MKLFEKAWIIRLDPKDPNGIPGMDLLHFTPHKTVLDYWKQNGVSLKRLGYRSEGSVRVKWVFPVLVIGAFKNKEISNG